MLVLGSHQSSIAEEELPMYTVLVTDNISDTALPILDEVCQVTYQPKLSADELLACIDQFDGLMIRSESKVNADVLAKAKRLKIVGRAGVGVDNVDLPAANAQGVVVVNSPEGNTVAASEHTVGLLLALARHSTRGDAALKQGRWIRKHLTGVELYGKTLGLIGLGKIGARVAKACLALGMHVVVMDPYVSQKVAQELNVSLVSLDELLNRADFITLHVPKTPETTNLLNAKTLAQCKPSVRIVNCARGGIINEIDLIEALKNGHVAAAALDVFTAEPIPPEHPLLNLDETTLNKLILTPHLGASTEEAQLNVALDVAEQLRDFFKTGDARSAVNLPLLRADILDPVRPYMPLAEALGSLARQLIEGPVDAVELTVKGKAAQPNVAPLSLAVLKGLLSVNREGVNYVNARFLAEKLGMDVKESKLPNAATYTNELVVRLKTPQGSTRVAGTLIASNRFRITQMDQFLADMDLNPPHILFVPHEDKPGMVAKVATVLGEAQVNIAAMKVGHDAHNQRSVMLFNTDSPVADDVLSRIVALEGCHAAKRLSVV
jgi:D-3-phosphoglycerate dehydrogenase / 2-oxoglutarate reductase